MQFLKLIQWNVNEMYQMKKHSQMKSIIYQNVLPLFLFYIYIYLLKYINDEFIGQNIYSLIPFAIYPVELWSAFLKFFGRGWCSWWFCAVEDSSCGGDGGDSGGGGCSRGGSGSDGCNSGGGDGSGGCSYDGSGCKWNGCVGSVISGCGDCGGSNGSRGSKDCDGCCSDGGSQF